MTVMDVIWWWFDVRDRELYGVWGIQSVWWWYVDKVLEGTEPEGNGALQDHIRIDANFKDEGPSRTIPRADAGEAK